MCVGLRRSHSGREERLLLHFNGHGVPRPSANGELWVFNRSFTQYIPVSAYDLQSWLGTPCILVLDCSNAARIIEALSTVMPQPGTDASRPGDGGAVLGEDVIVLGACDSNSQLPTNPELPADVFTCCLTTPLRMALRFASRNALLHLPGATIDSLPGALGDRRSPLGEINWIFTAITDSIAWDMLPREVFRRLFRQDLLLASLFRNFLLAQRVMARAGLYPVSAPALPPMHQHPLWESFDLVAEAAICEELARRDRGAPLPPPSPFFSDQLTAFEVWLRLGARGVQRPPEQLPILLQVLTPTQDLHAISPRAVPA